MFIGHDVGASACWRMCLYHPSRVAAVCSVGIPYYPPSDQCTDVDALVETLPQFAYLKLLGDSEATALKLEKAPRRFFNAVFHHTAEMPTNLARIIENVESGEEACYSTPSMLLTDDELEYYDRQIGATTNGFLGGCYYYGQWRRDFETERDLPRDIPHQALFIATTYGHSDEATHQQVAAGMRPLIPNLETAIIHEAGHWVVWEKKEQVTTILLEWLAERSGDGLVEFQPREQQTGMKFLKGISLGGA